MTSDGSVVRRKDEVTDSRAGIVSDLLVYSHARENVCSARGNNGEESADRERQTVWLRRPCLRSSALWKQVAVQRNKCHRGLKDWFSTLKMQKVGENLVPSRIFLLSFAMFHVSLGLALAGLAAGAASFDNQVVSLNEMDTAGVQDLLQSWGLQEFFGPEFLRHKIDGEMLSHFTLDDVDAEIRALRPDSPARSFHWRKLWSKLEEERAERARKLKELEEGARRQLVDSSGVSGVHVKHDGGAVILGVDGDVALQRTGASEMMINSSVTITDDLNVAGSLSVYDQISGEFVDVASKIRVSRNMYTSLSDDVQAINDTLTTYASSSQSSGHGSDSYGWTHVASFGCGEVLTSSAVGSQGDVCYKESDSTINALMCNSELKIEFYETGDTLFVQLVDDDGELRDWHYDPNPNTAKWRWVETLPWKGPCSHDSQLSYGHFFFFKTATRYGDCESGNYENAVYDSTTTSYEGFTNRDSMSSIACNGICAWQHRFSHSICLFCAGATFFPVTGWDPHIQMFVRTVCD